jgi:RimJ/RimL family protein N-acetyltransferase
MRYFKKLIGKRVYLSTMNPDDVETYVKWLNDFSVTENLGNASLVVSLGTEKDWLEKNTDKHLYAIVKAEDDTLLGNCGFSTYDQTKRCAEVGIFIGEADNRNKGYGAEALSLLVDYGFDYLNLKNIMLKVFEFNERAIQCYKKVGFREFGRRRQAYFVKGKYYDEVYMDILKEDRCGKNIKD